MARLEIKTLQVIGSEIALAWADGLENYFKLEFLRRACPCAACGGEPDVMGNVIRPDVTYKPTSFTLRSHQIVGGYGWQPTWSDGHNSGIYSFQYLRRLGAIGENEDADT